MTVAAPTRQRSRAARRVSYAIAAAINAALMYAVNVWPAWQSLSFRTENTHQVLGMVNLSVTTGVIANVIYLAHDPPWVKARGDLVTTGMARGARTGPAGGPVRLPRLAVSTGHSSYYHLDRMIGTCARRGADIACCGTCMDARGIAEDMLTKGTRRSTLDELADWTLWAEKVITF